MVTSSYSKMLVKSGCVLLPRAAYKSAPGAQEQLAVELSPGEQWVPHNRSGFSWALHIGWLSSVITRTCCRAGLSLLGSFIWQHGWHCKPRGQHLSLVRVIKMGSVVPVVMATSALSARRLLAMTGLAFWGLAPSPSCLFWPVSPQPPGHAMPVLCCPHFIHLKLRFREAQGPAYGQWEPESGCDLQVVGSLSVLGFPIFLTITFQALLVRMMLTMFTVLWFECLCPPSDPAYPPVWWY